MSSDRPRTPPRSTISDQAEARERAIDVDGRATVTGSTYVPHVSDLVYSARDASRFADESIPPIYLEAEAVDSSILLGHGASFTASVRTLPDGPKTIDVTTNLSGLEITSKRPAPPRPTHVVYKTARIALDKTGEPLPQYRRAMQSVLTEFHALIHPDLFKHPNMIKFLGMAWGSNPFSSSHRLPALMVEYAEHGTLSRLLQKEPALDFKLKHLLSLDVVRGLSALHQVGLVHGDVKLENILVCSSPDRKFVAKLSDFGFSFVTATESDEVWMGGTDPWRAPETKIGPVKIEAAPKTDTYSFGLLIWVICLNGYGPFKYIEDHALTDDEIEVTKRENRLLAKAQDKAWLLRYLEDGHYTDDLYKQALSILSTQRDVPEAMRAQVMQFLPVIRKRLATELASRIQQHALVKCLNNVFEHSLQSDPECRDLDLVLAILESIVDTPAESTAEQERPMKSTSTNEQQVDVKASAQGNPERLDPGYHGVSGQEAMHGSTYWLSRGYKKRWFSWQKTRDLEPSVQDFMFNSFLPYDKTENSSEIFMLCSHYMNGYGCKPDVDRALDMLRQAATLGHLTARAFMYRIWQACRPHEKNPGIPYLEDYAKAGSKSALADIEKAFPNQNVRIYEFVRDATGGVGAGWLRSSEVLGGYTQSQWIEDDWLMEKVRNSEKPISEIVINKRRDGLLHFTAMCGRWRPLKSLVLDYKMDINQRNPLGETPLLCACRAGQGSTTIYCLQVFHADASLTANNGESPLHWLVRFGDANVEAIAQDMLKGGAKIDAATKERISHSHYPATAEIDWRMPGTALAWAVHDNRPHIVRTLLKYGADPRYVPDGAVLSPLVSAAYYHHHECLRVMIDFLEPEVNQTSTNGRIDPRFTVMYGPLIIQAEFAADKFSMILRHGADYLKRLHDTLDLLRQNTPYAKFEHQMDGSMLYTAVSKAHDEVVEYMFQKNWLVATINKPIGDSRRTPVLEAIRWNREHLVQTLLDNGADIHAQAANPFAPEESNWSALHIFAHEGHDRDLSLVEKLVHLGLPVDGTPDPNSNTADDNKKNPSAPLPNMNTLSINDHSQSSRYNESPFSVALRHNAFSLATTFLYLGADPNALALTAGLFSTIYPTTPLGHLITSNARYSHARLNFLLSNQSVTFIVEPARNLTALHRCAMAHMDIMKRAGGAGVPVTREEFDGDTNADILDEILQRWKGREELDARCAVRGDTALHFAVRAGNLAAVRALLDHGADMGVRNWEGRTAYEVLGEMMGGSGGDVGRIGEVFAKMNAVD